MGRKDAERLLLNPGNQRGIFLVRESETTKGMDTVNASLNPLRQCFKEDAVRVSASPRCLLPLYPGLGWGAGRQREALQSQEAWQRRVLHHNQGAVRHSAETGKALHRCVHASQVEAASLCFTLWGQIHVFMPLKVQHATSDTECAQCVLVLKWRTEILTAWVGLLCDVPDRCDNKRKSKILFWDTSQVGKTKHIREKLYSCVLLGCLPQHRLDHIRLGEVWF